MAKLYFEDLPVGRTLEVGGYAVEKDEIVAFARKWDPYPFHVDEAAAKDSVFGGLTASSCHIVAICTALFHRLIDAPAILAMLGKDALVFPAPARPGDILTYRAECIEARESRSQADRGIVRFKDGLRNQAGDEVLRQEVTLLVARTPKGM